MGRWHWDIDRLDGITTARHTLKQQVIPVVLKADSKSVMPKTTRKRSRNVNVDDMALNPGHIAKHNIRSDWLQQSKYIKQMTEMGALGKIGILENGRRIGSTGRWVIEAPSKSKSSRSG